MTKHCSLPVWIVMASKKDKSNTFKKYSLLTHISILLDSITF